PVRRFGVDAGGRGPPLPRNIDGREDRKEGFGPPRSPQAKGFGNAIFGLTTRRPFNRVLRPIGTPYISTRLPVACESFHGGSHGEIAAARPSNGGTSKCGVVALDPDASDRRAPARILSRRPARSSPETLD